MAAFVITSWHANDEPQPDTGEYVRIQGRAGGLISWLLTLNDTLTIGITGEGGHSRKFSSSGRVRQGSIPLGNGR